MKSKSGWLADGEPTSISLNPIFTSSENIFSWRAGSIGSISAWLPSRRSTEHHSGALVVTTFGQVRSVSTIGTYAWYFSNGIFLGVTFAGGIGGTTGSVRVCSECDEPAGKSKKPPAGGWGRADANMWRSPYIRRSSPRRVITAILASGHLAGKVPCARLAVIVQPRWGYTSC